jgi:hypothetical protein
MQIAYQIAHNGQGSYDHIHDVVPWPESPHMKQLDHKFMPVAPFPFDRLMGKPSMIRKAKLPAPPSW